jgi:hypothetical protein
VNDGTTGRVQSLNQLVRSLITLGLSAFFIYGFIIGKISGEVFTNLVVVAVTWWFSRDQSTASAKAAVDLLKTNPPGNGMTTTTVTEDAVTTTSPTRTEPKP